MQDHDAVNHLLLQIYSLKEAGDRCRQRLRILVSEYLRNRDMLRHVMRRESGEQAPCFSLKCQEGQASD